MCLTAALGFGAACNGRNVASRPVVAPVGAANAASAPAPTLRIYYLVDLDGYLEPCGCQARPLGGIDRLARFMEAERARAPHSLFVAAGDLLFRDPQMDPRMTFQETSKAESMVRILDQLGLAAYAPGPSDFVRGADEWLRLTRGARAAALTANANAAGSPLAPALQRFVVREVNGVRVGIVGVSDFRESPDTAAPAGAPATTDALAATREAVTAARAQGARLVVVLASVPRREARSIARDVPGVDFVVAAREESTNPPAPERIGNAYLVTAANQGKTVGVLDVFVRPGGGAGLVDASETTVASERARLDARIADLRARVAEWERDPAADRNGVAQQRGRLLALQRERAALDVPRAPPAQGSYFRGRVEQIAPELARRPDVQNLILTYFHAVNEHNRVEYASLRAPAPRPGQAHYVGQEACRDCHEAAFEIWDRTPHSRAWHTLVEVEKNFNLSCVSCHVTGYRQPGGAEVVQNEGRQDVQCESCHGPGSAHIAARTDAARRAAIRREVPASFCANECHTPEHSDHFDYATYLPRILGPGHGYPVDSDAGGVSLDAAVMRGGATPNLHQQAAAAAHDAGAPAH